MRQENAHWENECTSERKLRERAEGQVLYRSTMSEEMKSHIHGLEEALSKAKLKWQEDQMTLEAKERIVSQIKR